MPIFTKLVDDIDMKRRQDFLVCLPLLNLISIYVSCFISRKSLKLKSYNDILVQFHKVRSGEGKIYTDLTPITLYYWPLGVERLFLIDHRLKRKVEFEARL